MADYTGKVAVVAGGAGAIGRAVAAGLLGAGASVALADVSPELRARAAALEVGSQGRVVAIETDLTDESAVDSMMANTLAAFGRVDALIHAAGIFPQVPISEMTSVDWDATQAINLRSFFLCTRAALRCMLPQGDGRIIGITSGFAVVGRARGAAYASTKAAMIAFAKSVAAEIGDCGVTINCIAPGITDSPMMRGALTEDEIRATVARSGRPIGDPAALVGPVLFLLGSASRSVSGTTLWMRNPS